VVRPKAPNGAGTIEVLTDKNGYVTLRPRVHAEGQRYHGASVGIRRGATKREQATNERAAWAQARKNLAELKQSIARGERPDPQRARRSVGAQLRLWLEAKKGKVTDRNWKSYESAVRVHMEPYRLARVPLGKIQGEDVDAWLADMREAGVSTAMARYAFDRLHECFRSLLTGVAMDNVQTLVNAAKTRRPRHRKQQTRPFDEAERRLLLNYLTGGKAEEPWASLFATALVAGLRYSEAAGLPWGEVHWTDRSLFVRWQLDRDSREPRELKTEESGRTVPLGTDAVTVLRGRFESQKAAGKPVGPLDLVWTARPWGGKGERGLGYSQARRKLIRFCEEAGLSATGKTHALRHTFGTTLARAGVREGLIQPLLGHSDGAATRIYTRHTVPAEHRQAIEAADTIGIGITRGAAERAV
jgi:integrase